MQFLRYLIEPPPPFVIGLAGCQINEILGESALERVDRHVVVVEHNQQVVLIHRGVVQSLESQTAGHRPVADDSYDVLVSADIHAQRSGNRVAGMSCDEGVVLALCGVGEGREPFELSVCMKTVPSTREDLMRVSLMTYVPNELVLRGVEHIMEGYRQLDSTQRRSQMTGVLAQRLDDKIPQLRTHRRQFLYLQLLQIRRRINPVDILIFHFFFKRAHICAN